MPAPDPNEIAAGVATRAPVEAAPLYESGREPPRVRASSWDEWLARSAQVLDEARARGEERAREAEAPPAVRYAHREREGDHVLDAARYAFFPRSRGRTLLQDASELFARAVESVPRAEGVVFDLWVERFDYREVFEFRLHEGGPRGSGAWAAYQVTALDLTTERDLPARVRGIARLLLEHLEHQRAGRRIARVFVTPLDPIRALQRARELSGRGGGNG